MLAGIVKFGCTLTCQVYIIKYPVSLKIANVSCLIILFYFSSLLPHTPDRYFDGIHDKNQIINDPNLVATNLTVFKIIYSCYWQYTGLCKF